jgi:hypothetical protein
MSFSVVNINQGVGQSAAIKPNPLLEALEACALGWRNCTEVVLLTADEADTAATQEGDLRKLPPPDRCTSSMGLTLIPPIIERPTPGRLATIDDRD